MIPKQDRVKVRADKIQFCSQKLLSKEISGDFKCKYLESECHPNDLEIDAVFTLNKEDVETIKRAIKAGTFAIRYMDYLPEYVDHNPDECLSNLFGGWYKFQKRVDTNEGILANEEQDLDIVFPLGCLPSDLLEQDESERYYFKTLRKRQDTRVLYTHALYKIKK